MVWWRLVAGLAALVIPVTAMSVDSVHPWWAAAIVVALFALPVLVWVIVARGRLGRWVTLAALPALAAATFAISYLQPGNARPPVWDFLVAFGVLGCALTLVLLPIDLRRSDPRRPRPYGLGIGLVLLALFATAATALVRHDDLRTLSTEPTRGDIPPLPAGFAVVRTLSDCTDFCGGILALSHPDRPDHDLVNAMGDSFIDAGWRRMNIYSPRLQFGKPVGGFLNFHELAADIEVCPRVLFPDEEDLICVGIGGWSPAVSG